MGKNGMKIVYMGTPDFAVAPLERMNQEGHDIRLVITQPDRPRDRGKKVQPTPVKQYAMASNLPVAQPETLKGNEELKSRIQALEPDLIVVVAYGKLLPADWLSIPRLGCVNIHGSLLPRFRGAAPIQWAILSGEKETGVTLMYLSPGMDEGDMIAKRATPIGQKTAGDLHDELSKLGAELLADTLPLLASGNTIAEPQDPGYATYAPPLCKQDGHVKFTSTSDHIDRQIRAMSPWPGAYAHYGEELMKLLEAQPVSVEPSSMEMPGTILRVNRDGILVKTIDNAIRITRIRMPGKRDMHIAEYIKGNQIEIGAVLR